MSEPNTTRHAQQLRRLLPAPTTATTTAAPMPRRPPKQPNVPTACYCCRQQKMKCSGERPVCGRCAKRSLDCQYASQPGETSSQALRRNYETLRHQETIHTELIDLLRSLPDQEAQIVLQKLRSGSDVAVIVDQVKAGSLLLQMSQAQPLPDESDIDPTATETPSRRHSE
ncbi:hypothetical protein BJ166DRAFT_292377 [Pestalotiopsis sp. NC0098]|nr:hypothetical protein BJ166DRAFT_292377 [Pestalotiopsis sp. NC0098]